jgi:hypothetical protein
MFAIALGLALAPSMAASTNIEPTVCPVNRTGVSPKIIVQGGTPATPSHHIIVQGGISPRPGGDSPTALGPKQDDPGPPPPADLQATKVGGMGDPAALGPKQDDPAPPPPADLQASLGSCVVQPGGSPR